MCERIDECSSSRPLSPPVPAERVGSSYMHHSTTPSSYSINESAYIGTQCNCSCVHCHENGQSCQCCIGSGSSCGSVINIPIVTPVVRPTVSSSVNRSTLSPGISSGSNIERPSNVGLTPRMQRTRVSPRSNNGEVSECRGRTDSISHLRREPGASIVDSQGTTYRIGKQIGRGGFGLVYQALNTETGDWVAVKCVSLCSIDNDSLESIRSEIDLLKKLNHVNIVQYIDTIQTEHHLHIVLEMMESSLSAMCKKFGTFSESLTAIYMSQVLEGLCYLHAQGVIHRDIKGANILTTKNGLLKLADFGVAKKLTDAASIDEEETDVVGTPYWMAPEMIEMTGLTTACDIWSVGITIIELVTGNPPYFDLPPMQALYRIVQDDHPPLPDTLSPSLTDFLVLCFRKESVMRKSASELLEHPWLLNHKAHIKRVGRDALSIPEDNRHGNSRQVLLKSVRTWADTMRNIDPQRRPSLKNSEMEDINDLADKLFHDLDKVILSPTKSTAAAEAYQDVPITKQHERDVLSSTEEDLDWDKELCAEVPGGTQATYAAEEDMGIGHVNGDFESSVHQRQQLKLVAFDSSSNSTNSTYELNGNSSTSSVVSRTVPKFIETSLDADALADWGEEDAYDCSAPLAVNCQALHRTSDGVDLACFVESEEKDSNFWKDFSNTNVKRHVSHSSNVTLGTASGSTSISEKGSGELTFAEVLRDKIRKHQVSALQEFELDDEFGKEFEANLQDDTSEAAAIDALMKVGKEIYEQLCKVDAYCNTKPPVAISNACMECSRKLICTPEARFYVLSANYGAIVLLNMLRKSPAASLRPVITLINNIVDGNAQDLEHVALMGISPDITAHVNTNNVGLRFEVAKFVHAMCTASTRTLEMFVSAGGMKVLVDLLPGIPEEIYTASSRAMIKVAVDGILDVFQMQQASWNDICRLFLNLDLLPRTLYVFKTVLNRAIVVYNVDKCNESSCEDDGKECLLDDVAEWSLRTMERIAHILMTFSKSDRTVKEGLVGADNGLSTIMEALPLLHPRFSKCVRAANLTTTLLTVLKNVSMESCTLWCLSEHKEVDLLVRMLERTGYSCDYVVESQVLQCMFYLCRLSRKRQEIIAMAGLIPYLIRCISENQNVKQFALSIFCDLAYSTLRVRDLLWQHNAIDFYIEIIQSDHFNWQVGAFRSIAAWACVDTERVEKKLVEPHALSCIVSLIRQKAVFESVVVELNSIMKRSTLLVKALGVLKEFMEVIVANLHYPNAIVVKSLLDILYLVFGHHSEPQKLIRDFNQLYPSVSTLADNNTQVLVSVLASQLLRIFDAIGEEG